MIVVTLLGVLLSVAIPRARAQLDRISVNAAIGDVTAVLHAARTMAIGVPAAVAVHIDTASGTLTVRHDSQSVMARGIGAAHGVRLAATRDSLAWDVRGLGRGAANLSIVVRRGAVAETVFVSRMGRVRTGG